MKMLPRSDQLATVTMSSQRRSRLAWGVSLDLAKKNEKTLSINSFFCFMYAF